MKILLCHNYYREAGGEDRVFSDERCLLEQQGHEVVTFTRSNKHIADMSRVGLAAGTLWSRRTARALRTLIRKERPQIMHCTNIFPLISPAAYYVARAEGVPVVQSLHNYRMNCANGLFLRNNSICEQCLGQLGAWPGIRYACYRESRTASTAVAAMQALHRLLGTWRKAVSLFITPSEFARQKFVAGGLPADRIVVKPNFVEPDPGYRQSDAEYAVFVGRLSPEKGITTMLEAWSHLRGDLKLKIVGDGPLASTVREAAHRDQRIEWSGWCDFPQVCDIIGRAALLVMPSVWYETFGRTIIEAYAVGTPVVASRIGALRELVEDGVTGALFTPGSATDLADRVQDLMSSVDRRHSLGVAARQMYESRFTATRNYPQLLGAYLRACGHSALGYARPACGAVSGG